MDESEILPHQFIAWRTLGIPFKKPRSKVFFKNTKNLLQSFNSRTKNLAEFPLFKEFHGSLMIFHTHFKITNPSSHYLSHQKKIFKKIPTAAAVFRPLSLSKILPWIFLFLVSEKIFFIALRTSFTSYQLQLGQIPL